jgi:integrase
VVPILLDHLERFTGQGEDAFVFPGRYGDVLNRSGIDDHWKIARQQLGLDDLHVHDLRHTALTWAARSGATLAELMAIAGHANPTIVLRYQHVGDEERRHAIAEKLGTVFQDELADRRARKAKLLSVGTDAEDGAAGT